MTISAKATFVLCLAVLSSGCASSRVADTIDASNISMSGTPQVIGTEEIYRVNLRSLLVTYSGCDPKKPADQMNVEEAFAHFHSCNQPDVQMRRNAVQDHIRMVADRRCEVYKQAVAEVDSVTTFGFGALSTVTGSLGALFADAAQGLSAASGISSGMNAQFSKSFFSDTAMPVLMAGIDTKRAEIAERIESAQAKASDQYSVQRAVSDAIQYNGACSAYEGMRTVQDSLAVVKASKAAGKASK